MSTRENIRLIARAPCRLLQIIGGAFIRNEILQNMLHCAQSQYNKGIQCLIHALIQRERGLGSGPPPPPGKSHSCRCP